MLPGDFYSLTYRQFVNMLKGDRAKREVESRERLLLTRKLMYSVLLPHLKKGATETTVWSFDWETEAVNEMEKRSVEELKEDYRQVTEFWANVDKKRNEKLN